MTAATVEKPTTKQRWRRSRTLSRRLEVRDIAEEDMRYAWAAFKLGKFADMDPQFADTSMTGKEFNAAFWDYVGGNFEFGTTILAQTPRGFLPAGMVFANLSPRLTYMEIAGIVWFPTASKRNIIEGTVGLFQKLRENGTPVTVYATDEHKRVYEVVCAHGILRRVGTTFMMIPGKVAAVFETKMRSRP